MIFSNERIPAWTSWLPMDDVPNVANLSPPIQIFKATSVYDHCVFLAPIKSFLGSFECAPFLLKQTTTQSKLRLNNPKLPYNFFHVHVIACFPNYFATLRVLMMTGH